MAPWEKNSETLASHRTWILLLTANSFGYADGISQPFVQGVGVLTPGQTEITPGVIVHKRPGDDRVFLDGRPPEPVIRPDWVQDGSIMAFRVLEQRVPEL
jgi:deferrochelatase/peroxidase EfeB